jgi:hypothetical protein
MLQRFALNGKTYQEQGNILIFKTLAALQRTEVTLQGLLHTLESKPSSAAPPIRFPMGTRDFEVIPEAGPSKFDDAFHAVLEQAKEIVRRPTTDAKEYFPGTL